MKTVRPMTMSRPRSGSFRVPTPRQPVSGRRAGTAAEQPTQLNIPRQTEKHHEPGKGGFRTLSPAPPFICPDSPDGGLPFGFAAGRLHREFPRPRTVNSIAVREPLTIQPVPWAQKQRTGVASKTRPQSDHPEV